MPRHALVLAAVEDDVLVDLVAQDEDAGAVDDGGQLADVRGRQRRAGRVVRRVEEDHPRPRRDGAADRVPVDAVGRKLQRHVDRRRAAEEDRRHVRVVAGLEDDDFVAAADGGGDRVEDRFRAAGGHRHFALGIVAAAVRLLVLRRDRLTQPHQPLHRRVLVLAPPHVGGDGVDQRRIAVEVGKALRQVDRADLGRQPRHHREDRRPDRRQLRLADHAVHSKVPVSRFLRT